MLWMLPLIIFGIIWFAGIRIKIDTCERKKRSFYVVKLYFLCFKIYSFAFALKYFFPLGLKIYIVTRKSVKSKVIWNIEKDIKRGANNRWAVAAILSLKIKKIFVLVKAGLEDAANTALVCGALNAISKGVFKKYNINVLPVFGKRIFRVNAQGILHIKPADIIKNYYSRRVKNIASD